MQKFALLKGLVGVLAGLAACSVWATTSVVVFPELTDPPSHAAQDPFPPQPPLTVGTVNFAVPVGEQVVAAQISGFWGSSLVPDGTAGVDVLVDGILVSKCVKPSPDCWESAPRQRPWTYTFKQSELAAFNDGVATMTAVQTSDISVRLGTSTLTIETAPVPPPPVILPDPEVPPVPTLSPLALLALIAGLAAAGVFLVRRAKR